jgi:hypothetical protein
MGRPFLNDLKGLGRDEGLLILSSLLWGKETLNRQVFRRTTIRIPFGEHNDLMNTAEHLQADPHYEPAGIVRGALHKALIPNPERRIIRVELDRNVMRDVEIKLCKMTQWGYHETHHYLMACGKVLERALTYCQ